MGSGVAEAAGPSGTLVVSRLLAAYLLLTNDLMNLVLIRTVMVNNRYYDKRPHLVLSQNEMITDYYQYSQKNGNVVFFLRNQ